MTSPVVLRAERVTASFGGLRALQAVSFELGAGQIVGLIGPNGAGKTTLFNIASGLVRPTSGHVEFQGARLSELRPHEICRRGLARTYQTVRPFLGLTVLENVLVGLYFGRGDGAGTGQARAQAEELLALVGLDRRRDALTRTLTLAERKMVELARALATEPTVLLLDEILSGLTPTEVNRATGLIRRLRDERGITIFWIEHIMRALMGTCERVIVLHFGQKIAEGSPAAVSTDPQVIEAYLGQGRTRGATAAAH